MKTKIIITTVFTLLLLTVTLKLRSNKHTVEENVYRPDAHKKVPVQAHVTALKGLNKQFSYTGTFTANREVMLVPQVHGQAVGVYFDEGDVVKKGTLLVQVDDDLLQAQYMAADANHQTAKRNLERYENASESGGVSKLQLDNFRLSLTSAESQLKQLAKQIDLSRIIAPFTGTITLRDVEPGSVVGGSPVARITDLTQLKLEISVPEKEVIFFREGETAEVVTDIYPGRKITGIIDFVADRADHAHNYLVRILITNNDPAAGLKAGMYGTALLNKSFSHDAVMVPRAALLGSAKNPQVFVVEAEKAVLRNIKTGQAIDESVEVLQGLQAGEVVVTTGHINLADGSNVAIIK